MSLEDSLNLLKDAVLLAGIYAAMSMGMTIIYGVMKIVNLSHAGFMMLGAYFAFELFERFHIDPILGAALALPSFFLFGMAVHWLLVRWLPQKGKIDRKSTRLNSSHANISYAVFCLKKKKKKHSILSGIIHEVVNSAARC